MPGTVLGRSAAALLAALVALAVLVRRAGEVPGDAALLRRSWPAWTQAVAGPVDALTGYAGTAVLAAVAVLVLVRRGRRGDALRCAVSVAGAVVGNALLKQLVARPRPERLPASVDVSPLSFPSGHAAGTAALLLGVVLAVRGARVAVAAAVLWLGAAAAQLVLGLHHPSDLVGGGLWGSAWTTAVWAAARRRPPGERLSPSRAAPP